MKVVRQLIAGGSLAAVIVFMAVATASAQTYTGVTPPEIHGGAATVAATPSATAGQVLHIASTPSSRVGTASVSSLPLTGADVAGLVLLAGALVISGLLVVSRTRNRSAS